MELEEPEFKGLVITLPPPNNPSIGKNITLYSLSDSPHQSHDEKQLQQYHQNPGHLRPIRPSAGPQNQFSINMLKSERGRRISGFIFFALCVFILWNCFSSDTLTEILRLEEDNHERSTFFLPLYPKLDDIELKLGRFVGKKNGVLPYRTASRLDTTVLPLNGNAYPYGLYFTYLCIGNLVSPYYLDMDIGSDLNGFNVMLHALAVQRKIRGVTNLKTGYCDTCQQRDYMIEYADRSSSVGVLARDELNLKGLNGSCIQSNIIFGCAYDHQGSLLNSLAKTDGILGLSRAKVTLPSQLASKGIINNVFGHGLTTDAGGSGYMFLGDELMPQRNIAWVSIESPFG